MMVCDSSFCIITEIKNVHKILKIVYIFEPSNVRVLRNRLNNRILFHNERYCGGRKIAVILHPKNKKPVFGTKS